MSGHAQGPFPRAKCLWRNIRKMAPDLKNYSIAESVIEEFCSVADRIYFASDLGRDCSLDRVDSAPVVIPNPISVAGPGRYSIWKSNAWVAVLHAGNGFMQGMASCLRHGAACQSNIVLSLSRMVRLGQHIQLADRAWIAASNRSLSCRYSHASHHACSSQLRNGHTLT